MENTNMQQETSTQTSLQSQTNAPNVWQMVNEGGAVLDAAALAAQSIAAASGLTSLESIASFMMQLHSRVQALENAAPQMQAFADLAMKAAESIPEGFVERVEGFFGRHFPAHAAPAAPATDAAKTE